MKIKTIDVDLMKRLFSFDPETGDLIRRTTTSKKSIAGSIVKTKNPGGYIVVRVNQVYFGAHRVAWALHYGYSPPNLIDHINGITTDNSISNLRDANFSVNAQNQTRASKNSSTGIIGVISRKKKFLSVICKNYKQIYLGTYATKEEAQHAYLKAKKVFHNE